MFRDIAEEFNGNVHKFKMCQKCGASLLKVNNSPEGYYLRCSRRERNGCMYEESFDSSKIITQKDNKIDVVYNKYKNDIKFLYHIIHKENLQSIIKCNYLFSFNKMHEKKIDYKNIAYESVQAKRSRAHNEVPFFINPKGPMLSAIRSTQDDIIIMCFNNELLFNNEKVRFTDGNIACGKKTLIFDDTQDLDKINWNCIRAKYWIECDPDKDEANRMRSAEILIKDEVSLNYLQKIICRSPDVVEYVQQQINSDRIEVEVNRDFYF